MAKNRKNKPGPKAGILKIEGDWEDAAKKIVRKKKPKGGWPNPEKKKR